LTRFGLTNCILRTRSKPARPKGGIYVPVKPLGKKS
jgi:hypothetical protein